MANVYKKINDGYISTDCLVRPTGTTYEKLEYETGKINSNLSYARIGNILCLKFDKTYTSLSANSKEIVTTALPFKCRQTRTAISQLVGTSLVGHASLYVNGNEVGVNFSGYGAAVTVQGDIMCFIED